MIAMQNNLKMILIQNEFKGQMQAVKNKSFEYLTLFEEFLKSQSTLFSLIKLHAEEL